VGLAADPRSCWREKGWLGADVVDVTKVEADKLGWDTPHGAKVGVVAAGSPTDKAGLRAGDIIVAVDRTMLDTSSEIEAVIISKPPGTAVRFQVISGGRERPITVTCGASEGPGGAGQGFAAPNARHRRAHGGH
jgi:serine protease Do